jgi:hypothetical protein
MAMAMAMAMGYGKDGFMSRQQLISDRMVTVGRLPGCVPADMMILYQSVIYVP